MFPSVSKRRSPTPLINGRCSMIKEVLPPLLRHCLGGGLRDLGGGVVSKFRSLPVSSPPCPTGCVMKVNGISDVIKVQQFLLVYYLQ